MFLFYVSDPGTHNFLKSLFSSFCHVKIALAFFHLCYISRLFFTLHTTPTHHFWTQWLYFMSSASFFCRMQCLTTTYYSTRRSYVLLQLIDTRDRERHGSVNVRHAGDERNRKLVPTVCREVTLRSGVRCVVLVRWVVEALRGWSCSRRQ